MIKRVKWNHHDILGDLELDFTKAGGTPYNTIVLAGENGVGKTTIMDTLSAFLNLGSFAPFAHITYEADGEDYTDLPGEGVDAGMGFHVRKREADQARERIIRNRNNRLAELMADTKDIRSYGCAYSKARSGFRTRKITSTTTSQLDSDRHEADTEDDFTRIKQMLVDVRVQDNENWATISSSGSPMTYQQFWPTAKMYRFENAFNSFFQTIRFSRIEDAADEKRVLFKKNGHEIPIDGMSTGEKQIVFRGAHLLKNLNGLNGGLVLVDEPELSLHPKWQGKALEYYRSLFKSNGTQNVQMIFATHSEYVVRAALEDPADTLVIVLTDDGGTIKQRKIDRPSAVLPRITAAETNFLAFGIYSTDYHIELYSYLQTISHKTSILGCDRYIERQTPKYDARKHGRISTFTEKSGRVVTYHTLPTLVRNWIDHPDTAPSCTQKDLEDSTDLLIELCR